jgi:hypothetical protein
MRGGSYPHGRTRGSWFPRLAGIGAVVLLATAAVIVYLTRAHPPAPRAHVVRLPSRVIGTQAVAIVEPGPGTGGGHGPAMLLTSPSGPVFVPMATATSTPSYPLWNADQMAGGGYVLIFSPSGRCLAAPASRRADAVTMSRCNLSASQRWYRVFRGNDSRGRGYWQLRSAADGKCLQAGIPYPAGLEGETAVRVGPCSSASLPWNQLISFWSSY